MNIFIVRHAESDNNIHGKFCTYTDGDLTPKGKLQAEYCKEELEHVKFDRVYSSHLIRAIKTAQIVGKTDDVLIFEELGEMHGGDYEAKTWDDIDKLHPDFHIRLVNSLSTMELPNGESYQNVKDRLLKFINKELIDSKLDKEANILIVSHGITLRILINILMGKSDAEVNNIYWADNTAITHIGWSEEKTLYNLLSNEHLINNGMDRSDYETWSGKHYIKL